MVCYGMYEDSVSYGMSLYDVRFLYDKEPALDADGNPLWCIEKQRIIPSFVKPGLGNGAIRSPKCNQVTTSSKYMCTSCENVPKINSLRLQVLRQAAAKTRSAKDVKDTCITRTQQLARLCNLCRKYNLRGNEIRRLKV